MALFLGQPISTHAQGLSAFNTQQQSSTKPTQSADGFQWISWLSAGEQVWKAVLRIEPKLQEIIGDGRTVSVATVNVDDDAGNEIILYFGGADDCGIDGCLYMVLNTTGRYKRAFVARSLKRVGTSLSVDGRYYSL